MIEIDGAYGEGGGQMIRTSMSLAAITHQNIHIKNIRAKRSKPGLMAQHLTACQAVAKICQGNLINTKLFGSTLTFYPNKITAGEFEFNIGTAGSVVLVAQSLIPPLLTAEKNSHIIIHGGTHVNKSPSWDYFIQVFLPAINRFGAKVDGKLIKVGFYPKGGGCVEINIRPSSLQACSNWDTFDQAHAILRYAKIPDHVTNREANVLREQGIQDIRIYSEETYSPGNAILLWQGFNGTYGLGERGKPAETVAMEAINEFRQQNASIDFHLADQILLYASLAQGNSFYETYKLTEHLYTNAYIIQKFIKREIAIEKNSIFTS